MSQRNMFFKCPIKMSVHILLFIHNSTDHKPVQSSDYKHESKLSFMEEPKSTIALAINRTWVNC